MFFIFFLSVFYNFFDQVHSSLSDSKKLGTECTKQATIDCPPPFPSTYYVLLPHYIFGELVSRHRYGLDMYTKSLVNTNLVNTNFTNTHFLKVPIPHLTRTMKQKLICTPSPWLTRICLTRISLTRIFKKFPFLT